MALTAEGLEVKRAADVIADLKTAAKSSPDGFGPTVSTDDDGPLGKILTIVGKTIADVWALMRQVYDAFDPDAATGEQLDNICALVGVTRLPATATTGTLELTGTPGTPIPAGALVRIPQGARFALVDSVTIGGGGTVDGSFDAEETGPIEATAGSITEIVTAVAGWSGVNHADDFTTGRDVETDAALRARREGSLQIVGAGPDQAIRARIRAIPEVIDAKVISNRTLVTDSLGIPGKAFLAVVWSGSPPAAAAEDVATAIYNSQPAGILSFGTEIVVITDEQDIDQIVRFSNASELDIYVDAILTVDPDEYPADGDDQVAAAIVEAGSDLLIGQDVVLLRLLCAAAEIPGVLTAEIRAKVGGPPGPGDTSNIAVLDTEIALIDALNVTVSS